MDSKILSSFQQNIWELTIVCKSVHNFPGENKLYQSVPVQVNHFRNVLWSIGDDQLLENIEKKN